MTSDLDLKHVRKEYCKQELDPKACHADPLIQLHAWLQEAISAQVNEPNAMNLATLDASGRPSARMVLCKGIEQGQVIFYSNYDSRKGEQLAHCHAAALTFFWAELERQVRVEGWVSRLPAPVSDEYFASRPYASRIGAWASLQSQPMDSKATLIGRATKFGLQYPLKVPRPPTWGGYGLLPDRIEFWQGRPSRLHDRLLYLKNDSSWVTQRLYP